MAFDRNEVQDYIRRAAASRGIDPTTALRVIKQESGFNPMATNLSPKEKSYGLMQLNTQGGLGVHALQKGIDIRDPNTWRQQVDFGLDVVKKDGWRQWYGARDVGIGRWDGIGGRPSGGGSDTLAGGAGNDTLGTSPAMAEESPKQSRAVGGLGGLGGWNPPEENPFGDILSAIGSALIAGDARVIPEFLEQRREGRERRADRDWQRQWMMETFGLQRQDRAEDIARDDRRFGIQGERYAAEQAESRRRFEIEQTNRLAAQNTPTADIREFEYARSNGFEGNFADWQRTARGQGGPPKASLSPVYGQDAEGKAVLIQPRDDGTAVATKLPEGVSVSTGTEQIDAGTHWVLKDKRSGEIVGTVPKDNFGSARDTALGTNSGKGEVDQFSGSGQAYRQADQMLSSIDGILKDPYLDWSTGMGGGVLSSIPGTPMRGVRAKIDQLGGQAFLQAFESLRGGGQITEVEGVKATQAIGRLDTAQSPEDYRAALGELRSVVLAARGRAERQAQSPPQTSQGAPIRAPMPVSGGNNDPLGLR